MKYKTTEKLILIGCLAMILNSIANLPEQKQEEERDDPTEFLGAIQISSTTTGVGTPVSAIGFSIIPPFHF